MKSPIEVFSDWAISGKDDGMRKNHFKPVMKMIKLFEDKYKNPCIIDAGCGNGWLVRHLDEKNKYKKIIGVDGSKSMIAKAKKLDPKNNYICSELDLWKPDYKADVVISMEVMYYFKKPEKIIKHIFNNWIKKNGVFIMGIDFYLENKKCHDWKEKTGVDTMELFSSAIWIKFFEKSGFKNVNKYFFNEGMEWKGTLVVEGFKF